MRRSEKIESAISWAAQHGYCFAADAAREYAEATGAGVTLRDLGTYGHALEFHDSAADAESAIANPPYPGAYRPLS